MLDILLHPMTHHLSVNVLTVLAVGILLILFLIYTFLCHAKYNAFRQLNDDSALRIESLIQHGQDATDLALNQRSHIRTCEIQIELLTTQAIDALKQYNALKENLGGEKDYKTEAYIHVLNFVAKVRYLWWKGNLDTELELHGKQLTTPALGDLKQLKNEFMMFDVQLKNLLLPNTQLTEFERTILQSEDFVFEKVIIPIKLRDKFFRQLQSLKAEYQSLIS